MPVVVKREALDSAVASALIGALNAELAGAYPEPGATHFGLTSDEVSPGRGAFVVAYLDGAPAGCGAVRRLDAASAELKRMYVAPAARGRGIGRTILEALEEQAAELGAQRVLLETGIRQTAATAMYRRAGYRDIAPYGEYLASAATSLCMAKDLPARTLPSRSPQTGPNAGPPRFMAATADYTFVTEWTIPASQERVWKELSAPEAWPAWWRGVERVVLIGAGDADGVGARREYTWKSRLPYRLTFTMETTRIEPRTLIEARATGELEGRGLWRLRGNGNATAVRYDWEVATTKAWMRLLAPLARPLFNWNHDVIMEWGRQGLVRRLAGGGPMRDRSA